VTPGYLLLEDGRRFDGLLRGGGSGRVPEADAAPGLGEVVFQTGMSGYQEVITDPSYRGQIVTFTASHIGNTGMNRYDNEAPAPALAGVIVRSLCEEPSSWRSEETLEAFLIKHGVPCLTEVDTRALTRHLREAGALRGVIVAASVPEKKALKRVQAWPGLVGRDLVSEVIPAKSEHEWRGWKYAGLGAEDSARVADDLAVEFPWDHLCRPAGTHGSPAAVPPVPGESGPRITLVHCGMKEGIDACLRRRGARVRIVRPDVAATELLRGDPDGILLSNGPGDPDALTGLVATVREVLGKVPIFGICLGFQILALSLGGKTYKLKYGHHGINHPVKDLRTGRILITSQNHGFAVDPKGFPADTRVSATHVSLNDETLEGFEVPALRVTAVQFHPEARGGPNDARYLFLPAVGAAAPAPDPAVEAHVEA